MNRWIVAFAVIVLVGFNAATVVASPQFGEDPDAVQGSGTTQDSNSAPDSGSFFDSSTRDLDTSQGSSTKQGFDSAPGSSNRTLGTSQGSDTAQVVAFEKKFWRYLSANNYKNWAPAPGETGELTLGQSPHGSFAKMYLNRAAAAANSATLPNGSVIVLENFGPEKSLQSIDVMYKSAGYNPQAGDWFWAKYNPNGTVVIGPDGSTKLAGRNSSCIECHTRAGGGDYAFFND